MRIRAINIMNVLSVMLDNQDVPQPNTKPLNQAILDADTEAYYSSDEDLHPFHEAPRQTPAARGAKKLLPQNPKTPKPRVYCKRKFGKWRK